MRRGRGGVSKERQADISYPKSHCCSPPLNERQPKQEEAKSLTEKMERGRGMVLRVVSSLGTLV